MTMLSLKYRLATGRSGSRLCLLDAFEADRDRDRVADLGFLQQVRHFVVGSLELHRAVESGAHVGAAWRQVSSPSIRRFSWTWSRDAMDREIADDLVNNASVSGVSTLFAASRVERDIGELLNIEKVRAAKMLVALGVVGVETVGANHAIEIRQLAGFVLSSLVLAADVAEEPIGVAEAGVGGTENDRRVFGVDLVVIGGEGWPAR